MYVLGEGGGGVTLKFWAGDLSTAGDINHVLGIY